VIKVDTAKQANRLINQGLALAFNLKIVKWYDKAVFSLSESADAHIQRLAGGEHAIHQFHAIQ
jgi:hypothetical protein